MDNNMHSAKQPPGAPQDDGKDDEQDSQDQPPGAPQDDGKDDEQDSQDQPPGAPQDDGNDDNQDSQEQENQLAQEIQIHENQMQENQMQENVEQEYRTQDRSPLDKIEGRPPDTDTFDSCNELEYPEGHADEKLSELLDEDGEIFKPMLVMRTESASSSSGAGRHDAHNKTERILKTVAIMFVWFGLVRSALSYSIHIHALNLNYHLNCSIIIINEYNFTLLRGFVCIC